MGISKSNEMLRNIEELKAGIDAKTAKKLDFGLLVRIIKRLDSFWTDCEECRKALMMLEEHINKLEAKNGSFDKNDINENHTRMNKIISHLQKEHKLVTEGSYMSIYMSLGISIGLVFGLTIFKNIGIGMPIGMCLGIVIGTSLDADAKKKGKII